jgi:hypothetical protein
VLKLYYGSSHIGRTDTELSTVIAKELESIIGLLFPVHPPSIPDGASLADSLCSGISPWQCRVLLVQIRSILRSSEIQHICLGQGWMWFSCTPHVKNFRRTTTFWFTFLHLNHKVEWGGAPYKVPIFHWIYGF